MIRYHIGLLALLSLFLNVRCRGGRGYRVMVDTVRRCTIQPYITETGTIRPVLEVPISPDVSGEVVQIYAKEGDTVRPGQVLMTIRPDNYQVALLQAQAALEAARAEYLQAESNLAIQEANFLRDSLEYERTRQLYEKKAVSEAEWDGARIRYQIAVAQVRAARSAVKASHYRVKSSEANLQQARINFERTSVYASIPGVVTRLLVKPGQRVVGVGQMAGTESIRLADLSAFLIEVQVSESDVVNLAPGNPVGIEVQAYPDQKLRGYVQEVGYSSGVAKPEASTATAFGEQIATYLVRIRIDPTSYDSKKYPLRPEMSALVRIYHGRRENVLCVPMAAVTLRDSVEVAFIYREGRAYQKQITTGASDDRHIEIRSGLSEGEVIVAGSYELLQVLRDSAEVRLGS